MSETGEDAVGRICSNVRDCGLDFGTELLGQCREYLVGGWDNLRLAKGAADLSSQTNGGVSRRIVSTLLVILYYHLDTMHNLLVSPLPAPHLESVQNSGTELLTANGAISCQRHCVVGRHCSRRLRENAGSVKWVCRSGIGRS